MDLRVLHYFIVIAEEENITKASQLLHITQPTLSRQIAALEEEVEAKLFIRHNHRISLTKEGRLFKRRAEEMLALSEKTKKELRRKEELSGTISIGTGEYKCSELLAEILSAFQKEHPAVRYEIFTGASDKIKERVENGLLDIVHLLEPIETSNYDFVRMPVKEEWGILVKDDCELAKMKSVTAKDIIKYPVIFTSRNPIQNEIKSWLGEYASDIKIIAVVNLTFHKAALTKSGMGISMTLKKDLQHTGVTFVSLEPKLELSTIIAWKKNQTLSPLTAAFIEFLRNYVSGNDK